LLDRWVTEVGTALEIPEHDRPAVKADQEAAVVRWARHIGDPHNLETYLFLRSHTRRGFIAQFPASRFLVSQMHFVKLLADDLVPDDPTAPPRARPLSGLLAQRSAARLLHTPIFFVEGGENLLPEQEPTYRRTIDHTPACIFMADAADGRIFSANAAAEELLG